MLIGDFDIQITTGEEASTEAELHLLEWLLSIPADEQEVREAA